MAQTINQMIGGLFEEMARGIETGSFGKRPKIAVTGIGGEHGEENALAGAARAAAQGTADILYIGTLETPGVVTIQAANEDEGHKRMEAMLDAGEIDAAVTMHFPFPIGVSTVGRAVAPANGREMFMASTTGTSATDRVEAMVRNAVAGIAAAKSCGIARPRVGVLNIDGARQAETILSKLRENGYDFDFAESARSDGGSILRGNDLLMGTPDVMVCDSLTGNVLMKMLSSFNTGGGYEATGYGYGPGLGEGYHKLVMIVSRASGAAVIAGAALYAAQLVRGKIFERMDAEISAAKAAGLAGILDARRQQSRPQEETAVLQPPKEIVTAQIAGIEIMDLEDAVTALWKESVYAQSGMGCTGPIVLVSDANLAKAREILTAAGFIQ